MKFPTINLSKNKNSVITGNQIGVIFNNTDFILSNEKIDLKLRESGKFNELFENQCIKCSPLYMEYFNMKIEQLIRLSQLYNFAPILRVYGYFTSLSTARQESESSDLAQLELLEKKNLLKFILNNFETRIIINLDLNMIFSNDRYTKEQYDERCKDLINTIKYYDNYKNLKIVIDSECALESMFILDTLLICYMPILFFDSTRSTYRQVIFDSELSNIINKIKLFDQRFIQLEKINNEMRKFMNASERYMFFDNCIKIRTDNYFSENRF